MKHRFADTTKIPPVGFQDIVSPSRLQRVARKLVAVAIYLITLAGIAAPTAALQTRDLSASQKAELQAHFNTTLRKGKGPYTSNFCVCRNGRKGTVLGPDGKLRDVCGNQPLFCAAFRAPWAESLAQQGMYIGNIFSRDLSLWESFADHHNLVRGYILEKYFVETHPEHKLAQLRAYGGLSGAEYEARDVPRFFEQYLDLSSYNDFRHFLLAYELQKRFFVRNDQGQIQKARAMATRIQSRDRRFKPLRDATHNQISAALIPKLIAYRDQLRQGKTRVQVGELIAEIEKLTSLDEDALKPQLAEIEDQALQARLTAMVPGQDDDAVEAIASLAALMVASRQAVAERQVSSADRRKLIDLNITAAAVIQRRGNVFLDTGGPQPVKASVRLLLALTNASYGVGLLTERERDAAAGTLHSVLASPTHERTEFARKLKQAERSVEWMQNGALLAFAEVWAPWTFLLPDTALIGDDILRGSPVLLYGQIAGRLHDYVVGQNPIRHEIFGKHVDTQLRALNPGLALGPLRVGPAAGSYSRNDVIVLPETPNDLQPAAGIVTQGEGNVVSHVQLLARALGIPNIVSSSELFAHIEAHDGQEVFFIVTPQGRVYMKEAAAMTAQDHAIYEEFSRNAKRSTDGSLGAEKTKLHIDRDRLDLSAKTPLPLSSLRRRDSGIRSGPKAAYLGELKHLFPQNVARGVVVPFGAYYDHYQRAKVAVPVELRSHGMAMAGEPLPDFVERTYAQFFDVMIPAATSEKELSAWIQPRLAIIQHSIRHEPLAGELKAALQHELERQGLLRSDDKSQTVGCFIRSDTNVEDLDNFNGAGLNLTLFNVQSVHAIYEGLKEVWASPFSFRSFSWRQPFIDEPLWVLPSVVILESVPSEKSGVLVTADVEHGDPDKMLVATSEGVGGVVDGTPAETLIWSPQGTELLTMFKSPWQRVLKSDGGSDIVPSTQKEYVLDKEELDKLIAAAQTMREKLEPVTDALGQPRPWDIEFGFVNGKLWLFQVRPFVGSDSLKNMPALAALDGTGGHTQGVLSLDKVLP